MDEQGVFSLIRNLRDKGIAAGAATTRYERSIARKEAELAEADLKRLVCALIDHVAELEALVKAVRDLMPKFYEQHFTLRNAECAPYCPRCHYYGEHEDECVVGTLEKLLEGADG